MRSVRILVLAALGVAPLLAQIGRVDATFGTIVTPVVQGGVNYLIGGASDLVLDEARGRLYLVNTGQRRVEVYSTTQRRFLAAIATDATPLSAALARDGSALYITCYDGSALNIVDPDRLAVVRRVSLPARPEGIAVGADNRVLITTIGTGVNNTANTLLIFDPNPEAEENAIQNVLFTPPPPPSPLLPPPVGRLAFATRTNLVASRDGQRIAGFNATSATQRALFVYEVTSSSVVRSRIVAESSSVLAFSPDGTRIMAGLRMFDAETLQVIAQQNAANLPYTLPNGSNFNVQQNQGGSVFAPDGSYLYTAFNFAPLQNPAARANVSQLLINDPENMLTFMGLKLPENLSGNIVISSDGGTAYALSESGFLILPFSTLRDRPIAMPDKTAVFLGTDQCGVPGEIRSAVVGVRNEGSGRLTATAQLVPTGGPGASLPAGVVIPAVGGAGGAGGGAPGAGVVVVLPPTVVGRPDTGATFPGGNTGLNAAQQVLVSTSPTVRADQASDGPQITFGFNAVNKRSMGTTVPHDFELYAPEAVNIAPQVRVYQNFRNADASAEVQAIPTGPSFNEGLVDIVADQGRQRLFIANSGLNRVEVFDMRSKSFLPPIKVGQLPRSLALTPDANFLYVANTGGESISVIDAQKLEVTGKVKFPALPFNSTTAIVTPSVLAATERGVQMVMNNGTLWRIVGDEALPRPQSPVVGALTVPAPRSMASTPNGEFAILLSGTGTVYLYDALSDEFVQSRQVITAPIQGFFGPIAAGPRGQYFLVNGLVLNSALAPVGSAPTGGTARPVAGLAAVGTNSYLRFAPAAIANANTLPQDPPIVESADPATGLARGVSAAALEAPISTVVGTGRVNLDGRIMAVDAAGTTAYVLTVSGLSIVNLQPVAAADRPVINANGVVSLGSQLPQTAPGGLVAIYGRNLGRQDSVGEGNLPATLGGVCASIGTVGLPLKMTSSGQINAQIPPELAAGRYQMVIRNYESKTASAPSSFTISRYAPAVLIDPASKLPAIYFEDGRLVSKEDVPSRDDRLIIYATGLGLTRGTRPAAGVPAPAESELATDPVEVYIDNPLIKESEMDVEQSILMPGLVGVYRIQIYVPWYRRRGDKLPVTVRIGGVSSPTTGPAAPFIPMK